MAGEEGRVTRPRRSECVGFGIFDRERVDRFEEARVGGALVDPKLVAAGQYSAITEREKNGETMKSTFVGIDKAERGKAEPSDHVPVWCELDVAA